jgi:hypothetical protein
MEENKNNDLINDGYYNTIYKNRILYKNNEKTNKKNKKEDEIEVYMDIITNKCINYIQINKNQQNIKKEKKENIRDDKCIDKIDFKDLLEDNYNVLELKNISKYFKLKISGNKKELLNRVFTHIYLSKYIIKIQKNFRKYIVSRYISLHGPAFNNKNLCVNNSDFITLEDFNDINRHQFISYRDIDNFIYGFSINSLYNLLIKNNLCNIKPTNPYNRNIIPDEILKNIKSLIRLGKLLDIEINISFEEELKDLSEEKTLELRALSLFQNIDLLGNYSNPSWFLSLNWFLLNKFIRELQDIWYYRAQLSNQTKINICPPLGDPFKNLIALQILNYNNNYKNLLNAKKIILESLEKLVNSGIDKDSKILGAYYVLGALTLVSDEAADSLPWLYQSFNILNF